MLIEIKHRYTQAVLFAHDAPDNTLAKTLTLAIKSEANLRYADLTGAILTGANLRYADLRYADLTRAILSYTDLRYADLTGANLTGANLTGANLRYADLTDANLTDANLTGANLTGANLTRADQPNRRKTMKYDIIADHLPELQERVTALLNQGWKLYGNPFQGAHGWFYQAIILEDAPC